MRINNASVSAWENQMILKQLPSINVSICKQANLFENYKLHIGPKLQSNALKWINKLW